MRAWFVLLFFTAALAAGNAQAETRTFIIANHPDGYGVDRCLATGETCGTAVATTYCRGRDFRQALSFRRITRSEVTGSTPNGRACAGLCDELVAIECGR